MLAVLILIAVYYFFVRRDETARAREPIDQMIAAVAYDERREPAAERVRRIERELDAVTTPDVTASIPEAPGILRGRAALLAFAGDVTGLHRLELGPSDVMASFDASRETAHFTLRLNIAAFNEGYERHEVRNASVQLVRSGETWLISSLTVAPRTHEQPEARP